MKNSNSTFPYIYFLALTLLLFYNCDKNEYQTSKEDWISLFDGETFTGWKIYGAASDSISPKWEIENGTIIASREGDGPGKNTGFDESIITVEQFENFELELEFMISEGGNSGIMYHIIEDSTIPMDYYTGLEYQILDDNYFEGKVRDFQYTASVFGLYPPTLSNFNLAGEWNQASIMVNNGKTEHRLNGALVLEFDRNSDEYNTAYEASQWSQFPKWGEFQKGHISLQDHGDMVAFRKIRIRKL